MLDKTRILDLLAAQRKRLRALGVRRLELFGSYAKGTQRRDSDIDLLVTFAKGRGGFRDYSSLLNLLEDMFGESVDLVKVELVREELRESILGGTRIAARV